MKKKFIQLCIYSDKLLKKYNNYIYISIIPSLHVLREHPDDLKKYKLIFEEKNYKILFCLLKSLLLYFIKSINNFFNKRYSYIKIGKQKNNIYDNIFVSHFINFNQINKKEDFYFNNMPIISSRYKKTLVILINHTQIKLYKHSSSFIKRNYDIIILSDNLQYKDKIKIFINSLKTFFHIFKDYLFNLKGFQKLIMLDVLSKIFDDSTQSSFRFYTQISEILIKNNPQNVFFTYEGYSWEKALCLAARSNFNSIKCIGYQHSRLYKYQHSINRLLNNNQDPNIILTSGKFSYQVFKEKLPKIKIINIGKARSKVDQKIYENNNKYFTIKSKIYVSVLPEGTFDEVIKLLNFSLECAKKYKNIVFIWRFHPLTNLQKVYKVMKIQFNLPSNIIISKQSLNKDLKLSNLVLYRGSTTVINAMEMGIIPLYYKISNEFDIDIFIKKNKLSIKVINPMNFIYQINSITKSKKNFLNFKKNAKIFGKEYFTKFNENKFKNIFCKN